MTDPTPTLSPAAEAVLDAANRFSSYGPDDCLNESRFIVAAALRAAADQVVPEEQEPVPNEDSVIEMQIWSAIAQRQRTRTQLLAIADELEAQPEPVQPAQNCCLDDSLSACVFDDSSERIEDCDFASALYDQGQPKTECYYYRAALEAQPEPVGPTKAELRQLFDDQSGYMHCEQVMWWADFHKAVRAALARWGRPAALPVPVSELPPRVGHILRLAEIIREVDESHKLGASALAEAILVHPDSRWSPAIEPVPTPRSEES